MSVTLNAPPRSEPAVDDEARWTAVLTRDRSYDGEFYYSVASTGAYCHPSCPSRLAHRRNVRFHTTIAEAEAAGFRPCKRCRPDQPSLEEQQAAKIAKVCRLIAEAEEQPKLKELAKSVGLSPYHFHRIFKGVTGVTPKAYATAERQKRIRERLGKSTSVTEAIYDAGFNSSGRFYAELSRVLGMTPRAFQSGGASAEIRFAVGECSLGSILVAASPHGVCAISFGDDPDALVRELQDKFPRARLFGGDADFERLVAKVVGFIEAPRMGFDLPLDVRGTAFQHRVWTALRDIPPGATASYAEIAERIGAPKAARAVAGVCAANKIAAAIPCHRIVRTDGAISGYRWGVERRLILLDKEAK
ncbi:bifunctional DNA-binding transcriptional regulator/O6-methylguanine-DNA methyltransferase Ada [Methylocapsa acidiphila]|uniref:bifunctional DNA-binding transcriptional regulator/O6-methylguanine-DNA methyltransferase Ada n=1 Tax=Methylocapsa acidiphila TaxID=133552 RepID=UPI00041C6C1C|nr:bifunctional DNA-binding transcriptional regulator/O6-methylguanine-DNA methyltransferase Ada [Methylocapsa acidiphila]